MRVWVQGTLYSYSKTLINTINKSQFFKYTLSSKTFSTNYFHTSLSNYLTLQQSIDIKYLQRSESGKYSNPQIVFRGSGILTDKKIKLEITNYDEGTLINIDNIAKFFVQNNLNNILVINPLLNPNEELFLEAFLGPVVVPSFANHNIFCLHGSGIYKKSKGILFLGDSCVGKSTIANYFDKYVNGLSRLADDIIPSKLEKNFLFALPHYPQLKINNSEQYKLDQPKKVRISHIYFLHKKNSKKNFEISNMKPQDSVSNLIKQTVASVLFDKNILKNHLEFCSKVVSSIPVKKIAFKHDKKCLPELCKSILDDVKASIDF